MSDSLPPHELQHARPPCPSPTPGVYSDSHLSSQWCHPAISSSVIPFSSCPQSLPKSKSFPMSQLFAWGDDTQILFSIKYYHSLPSSVEQMNFFYAIFPKFLSWPYQVKVSMQILSPEHLVLCCDVCVWKLLCFPPAPSQASPAAQSLCLFSLHRPWISIIGSSLCPWTFPPDAIISQDQMH